MKTLENKALIRICRKDLTMPKLCMIASVKKVREQKNKRGQTQIVA
jgi:hypothetical protein